MQPEALVLPHRHRPTDGAIDLGLLDLREESLRGDELIVFVDHVDLSSGKDGGHRDPDARRQVPSDEDVLRPELHLESPGGVGRQLESLGHRHHDPLHSAAAHREPPLVQYPPVVPELAYSSSTLRPPDMDETAVSKSLAGRTSKSCTGKSLLLYSVEYGGVFSGYGPRGD